MRLDGVGIDKRNTEATKEERQALEFFAASHPRKWKQQLLDDWANGRTVGVLQQIRNTRGPSWLMGFELKAKTVSPLSPDAQRVLNRIPSEWSNERDLRRALHDGLFLAMPAIAQILLGLERRGLIERGAWLADARPVRRTPTPEALS